MELSLNDGEKRVPDEDIVFLSLKAVIRFDLSSFQMYQSKVQIHIFLTKKGAAR